MLDHQVSRAQARTRRRTTCHYHNFVGTNSSRWVHSGVPVVDGAAVHGTSARRTETARSLQQQGARRSKASSVEHAYSHDCKILEVEVQDKFVENE